MFSPEDVEESDNLNLDYRTPYQIYPITRAFGQPNSMILLPSPPFHFLLSLT